MAKALRWGAAAGVLGFTLFAPLFFLVLGRRAGRPGDVLMMAVFALMGATFAAVLGGLFGAARSAMDELEELSYDIEGMRQHDSARRDSHR